MRQIESTEMPIILNIILKKKKNFILKMQENDTLEKEATFLGISMSKGKD